ncbi:uncharacterized protein LOC142554472 [Primulina tabacum]|uniref:uncharacterized protein LOC142554472 n=1 Tax=Primulina tabacum TaxID=48773 RepID=UPI003F594275
MKRYQIQIWRRLKFLSLSIKRNLVGGCGCPRNRYLQMLRRRVGLTMKIIWLLLVSEEHVVDGVANFMARCIVAIPKALNLIPQELQKEALGGINKVEKMRNIWHAGKVFYTMASWGLTLASLYQGPAQF